MPLELFKSRLTGMRKIVSEGKERALQDLRDFEHDRLIHPFPLVNARGEPQWEGSEAQLLLEFGIDEGLHEEMSPMDLYYSRLQYQDFALETFRGHIHQEVQTRKWRAQWVDGKKEYALVDEPPY